MTQLKDLIEKIENGTARVGIIGLGYVGLPLSMLFAEKFRVVGYDIAKSRIDSLLNGKSYITNVKDEHIQAWLNKTFFPTNDYKILEKCDFFIICVPTPLTSDNDPDLSYIKNASETISRFLKKGQFVILASTTYPGTVEEVTIPILEKTGLKACTDFGVAYSPERINPGIEMGSIKDIPTIVGGINNECTDITEKLYSKVFDRVVKVKDCKTAEATKIMENIFREVNIALVNEMALIFEKMGIDTWDVIDAASTKPFAFMPHYPGPGVGGHCIPLDPLYLSYKAKKYGFIPRFIEMSTEINNFMKMHTVNLIMDGLKEAGRKISGSMVAVLGLAYKGDIDDIRESPSAKIIEELINMGLNVKVYDPYSKSIDTRCGRFVSEKTLQATMNGVDCAVFITDHSKFRKIDPQRIVKLMRTPLIVDCRNILRKKNLDGIIYYCIGKGRR